MTEDILIQLVCIVVLGIVAQWLAWRISVPSILLLLIFGLIAGPVTGFLRPDELLGDLLIPLVSLSVAIILFEGGLNLKVRDLREIGTVVRNLITVGILVAWILGSLAAHFVLGLNLGLSVLLGSILVVTGPTVIMPLLVQVRPSGRVGSIAKWEGIVNDPIGAMLAVLVFEAIFAGTGGIRDVTSLTITGILNTILIGGFVGILGEIFLVQFMKRYWIPDFLQSPVTLMVVVAVFTLSGQFQEESGLLAVTIMGVILANQSSVSVRHIIEFKENLRILLISVLFIVLAARLLAIDPSFFSIRNILFLALLMLVVRPLSVIISTWGSGLSWQELAFLSCIAPRGVVAAAVSSVFSLRLIDVGYPQAEVLASLTFFVIIGTVVIYSLTLAPLSSWLGLSQPDPQGVLMVGASSWVCQMALALQKGGVKVLLVDTNYGQISKAYEEGLPTYHGNIMAEQTMEEINLEGMGRIMAMTSNDKANSLAALHFSDVFGRAETYQLPLEMERYRGRVAVAPQHLHGRFLFDSKLTYSYLNELFKAGARVETFKLSPDLDYRDIQKNNGDLIVPLFSISETGTLFIFTTGNGNLAPQPGQTHICLIIPKK